MPRDGRGVRLGRRTCFFRGVGIVKTHYRLVAVALSFLGTVAWAQTPAAAPLNKVYSKHNSFKLPFNIDESQRNEVSKVKPSVKTGPNEQWLCKETAEPAQKSFTYNVP